MLCFSSIDLGRFSGVISGSILSDGIPVMPKPNTPEGKAAKAAYDRARYEKNAEEVRARASAWYAENTERGIEKSRARYKAKKDEILAQQKAKRLDAIAADPAYLEREREQFRKQYAANPEKYREKANARGRKMRAADPDATRQKQRYRYWANPEKARAQAIKDAANRRARKMATGDEFTVADIEALLVRQKDKCAFCLKPLGKKTPHVDHYMPLARDGSNGVRNLRLLHATCNLRKHAKHPIDFAIQNGMLCW